mmetsp:Transcript_12797/g.27135  ORF Transcript_12797/g.27135 Transcript_12797/m.27135 type:complete len:233 (+) Transcript_12797:99-797(+)
MIATMTVATTKTTITTAMPKTKPSNWSIRAKRRLSNDLFLPQLSVDNTLPDCDRSTHGDSNKVVLPFLLFRNKRDSEGEDVVVSEDAEAEAAAVVEEEEEEGEEEVTTTIVSIVNHLWPSSPIGSRWRNSILRKSRRTCLDPAVPIPKSRRKPWKMLFLRLRMYCGVDFWINTMRFTTRSLRDSQFASSVWQQRNFIPSLPQTILYWRSWLSMELVVPEMVTREAFSSPTIF